MKRSGRRAEKPWNDPNVDSPTSLTMGALADSLFVITLNTIYWH